MIYFLFIKSKRFYHIINPCFFSHWGRCSEVKVRELHQSLMSGTSGQLSLYLSYLETCKPPQTTFVELFIKERVIEGWLKQKLIFLCCFFPMQTRA